MFGERRPARKRRRAAVGLAAAVLVALAAVPGAGAQPARDPAMAEALFASAKALLDQGDWAGACAKFQASLTLDPAVSTMLKIEKCHEHEGKLALAWSDAREALKLNRTVSQPEKRRKELEDYTTKLLADLEKRVPKLRVRVPAAPAGLRLSYDGRSLPVEVLDVPLPVDPGTHEILAEAEGCLPLRKVVTLAEGQALDVDLVLAPSSVPAVPAASSAAAVPPPATAQAQAQAAPGPAAAAAAAPGPRETRETAQAARPGSTQRAAGIGVGALGVAALGAAGVLGILTLGKVGEASPYCAADFSSCHERKGLTLLDEARGMQTAAFVLLGVGAAAAGTGVAVFLTAPRAKTDAKPRPEVTATLGPLGLTLRGAW